VGVGGRPPSSPRCRSSRQGPSAPRGSTLARCTPGAASRVMRGTQDRRGAPAFGGRAGRSGGTPPAADRTRTATRSRRAGRVSKRAGAAASFCHSRESGHEERQGEGGLSSKVTRLLPALVHSVCDVLGDLLHVEHRVPRPARVADRLDPLELHRLGTGQRVVKRRSTATAGNSIR
jgi:hypothetical protein